MQVWCSSQRCRESYVFCFLVCVYLFSWWFLCWTNVFSLLSKCVCQLHDKTFLLNARNLIMRWSCLSHIWTYSALPVLAKNCPSKMAAIIVLEIDKMETRVTRAWVGRCRNWKGECLCVLEGKKKKKKKEYALLICGNGGLANWTGSRGTDTSWTDGVTDGISFFSSCWDEHFIALHHFLGQPQSANFSNTCTHTLARC